MEKFITVEYCKRHQKFPTKTDFMAFVKTSPALVKFMKESDLAIEEFKESKLEELDEFTSASKIASSRAAFLVGVKERQRDRIDGKKQAQKDALKSTMRDEIMRELKEEKAMAKYSDYIPLDPSLRNKFTDWLDRGLDESQLEDLMKLKDESDKLWKANQRLVKKLELFESSV